MNKISFALGALLLVSAPAFAYVPPAPFLLKTIAAKHAAPKGLRFRGVVNAYEGEIPSGIHFKLTCVLQEETGRLRAWASDEAGNQLYVVEQKLSGGLSPLSIPVNVIGAILMDSNPSRIAEALEKEGIAVRSEAQPTQDETPAPPSNVFLARWNKAFAWVIGKRSAMEAKHPDPQLWIEKDTFYPVRYVPMAAPIEFQFENTRYSHDIPFPRAITEIQEKRIVFRVDFQDLTKNPATDLISFKTPVKPGFTDLGAASSTPIRQLIQRFFEGAR